jgi:hyaluronan synthase
MVFEILVTTMVYASYVVIFLGVGISLLAFLNKVKYSRYRLDEDFRPSVSFITPAYNEEQFIENTIRRYLRTTYPEELKEMVVVNDGSRDRTGEIAGLYASRIIDSETGRVRYIPGRKGRITLVNRKLGGKGKAYALNDGIRFARGEFFLVTDGDIELAPDIFSVGLKHFSDPRVGVVIGFASVKKTKRSILNNYIDYEFFSGQALNRRGYNVLGAHYIVPGGMSFFRGE